jgi:hypothetical protein
MTGAKKDGKRGTDLPEAIPPVTPVTDPVPGSPPTAPSDEERKARLKRAVANLTREFRANVRSESDFEALLVRGKPVNHRVHLTALAVLAALGLALGLGMGGGVVGLLKGALLPAAYGVFWLVLARTGGEELDHITVDAAGVVHSNKSGRDVEARGDFARVAIPIVLIAVSGWITFGLVRDIIDPPQPVCNVVVKIRPDDCISLPNIGALINASVDVASPGASSAPGASPSASPGDLGAGPSNATSTPAFTRSDWILLERIVRSMQLFASTLLLVSSIWFVRRMLTGRWVLTVRPVHHRLEDE